MKKILVLTLVLMMALLLTACGGGNKKAIVGTWQLVDTETETEYGLGIEFKKDGTLSYGLTSDMLIGLSEGELTEREVEDAMDALGYLMKIEYKVKSDTELEITASALMGLAKERTTVEYSLKGDTLEFDGATYTRVG